MKFIKSYLRSPILTAIEKGKEKGAKLGLIGIAIFFVYVFLFNVISAWNSSTSSYFYEELSFGDKWKNYFKYLFEKDGLIDCLKTSLIAIILFALFALAIFLVLKLIKKSDISYIRIINTILVGNIYIVPISLILGVLGMFDIKIIIYITSLLNIIYIIGLLVLNIYILHSLTEEENYDKSLLYILISSTSFIICISIIWFIFGNSIEFSILESLL